RRADHSRSARARHPGGAEEVRLPWRLARRRARRAARGGSALATGLRVLAMQLELMGQGPPVVSVASGARAAEAGLCAAIDRWVAEGVAAPALLRVPVRVIVPSR